MPAIPPQASVALQLVIAFISGAIFESIWQSTDLTTWATPFETDSTWHKVFHIDLPNMSTIDPPLDLMQKQHQQPIQWLYEPYCEWLPFSGVADAFLENFTASDDFNEVDETLYALNPENGQYVCLVPPEQTWWQTFLLYIQQHFHEMLHNISYITIGCVFVLFVGVPYLVHCQQAKEQDGVCRNVSQSVLERTEIEANIQHEDNVQQPFHLEGLASVKTNSIGTQTAPDAAVVATENEDSPLSNFQTSFVWLQSPQDLEQVAASQHRERIRLEQQLEVEQVKNRGLQVDLDNERLGQVRQQETLDEVLAQLKQAKSSPAKKVCFQETDLYQSHVKTIADLQVELAKAKNTNVSRLPYTATPMYAAQEKKIADAQTSLSSEQEAHEKTRGEVEVQERLCKGFADHARELQAQLSSAHIELTDLREELDSQNAKVAEFDLRFEEEQEERQTAKAQATHIEDLENKLQEHRDQVHRLTQERSSQDAKLSDITQRLVERERKLAGIRSEASCIAELQSELAAAHSREIDLVGSVDSHKTVAEYYESQVQLLKDEICAMKAATSNSSEKESCRTEALLRERNKALRDLEQMSANVSRLTSEHDRLVNENQAKLADIEELRSETHRLTTSVRHHQAHTEQLLKAQNDMRSQRDQARLQLDMVQAAPSAKDANSASKPEPLVDESADHQETRAKGRRRRPKHGHPICDHCREYNLLCDRKIPCLICTDAKIVCTRDNTQQSTPPKAAHSKSEDVSEDLDSTSSLLYDPIAQAVDADEGSVGKENKVAKPGIEAIVDNTEIVNTHKISQPDDTEQDQPLTVSQNLVCSSEGIETNAMPSQEPDRAPQETSDAATPATVPIPKGKSEAGPDLHKTIELNTIHEDENQVVLTHDKLEQSADHQICSAGSPSTQSALLPEGIISEVTFPETPTGSSTTNTALNSMPKICEPVGMTLETVKKRGWDEKSGEDASDESDDIEINVDGEQTSKEENTKPPSNGIHGRVIAKLRKRKIASVPTKENPQTAKSDVEKIFREKESNAGETSSEAVAVGESKDLNKSKWASPDKKAAGEPKLSSPNTGTPANAVSTPKGVDASRWASSPDTPSAHGKDGDARGQSAAQGRGNHGSGRRRLALKFNKGS